jgi:hypothetical protein
VFPTWRGQAFAVAVVNAAVLLLWPLIPESGRWLLAQGRKAEALHVLERFARLNGTRPPDRALADMALADGAKRLTLGSALRDWHIARRSLVLAYAWMVICMTYYVSPLTNRVDVGPPPSEATPCMGRLRLGVLAGALCWIQLPKPAP